MVTAKRVLRSGGLVLAVAAVVTAGVVVTQDDSAPATPLAAPPAAAPPIPAPAGKPAVRAAPALDTRSTVVAAPRGVRVFAEPDGKQKLRLAGETDLGAVQTLLAVGSRGDWWKVALPVRPNDATGWVRKTDVQASTISIRIEIDLKQHSLTWLRDGKVVKRFPVAVGTKATPTPGGLFYVTDNLDTGNPRGAFGPYALGLSGHSDVLFQFGGGDGVLGIHGTNAPKSIGTDASHGCIRMRNADITELRRAVPLGTPVRVV